MSPFLFHTIKVSMYFWLITLIGMSEAIYGPSIELLTRSSSNGRLPPNDSPKTVYLEHFKYHTVVLPLMEQDPTVDTVQAVRYFRRPHHPLIYIRAPPKHGISAVIQAMGLPPNQLFNCVDYVGFTDTSTGTSTGNICGVVSKDDSSSMPDNLFGPRFFLSDGDEVALEVHISTEYNHTGDGDLGGKNLTLEITFTGFIPTSDKRCNSMFALDVRPLRACADTAPATSVPIVDCISAQLFCDGVINCAGGTYADFGFDERNCTVGSSAVTEETLEPEEERILDEINYRKQLVALDRRNDDALVYYGIVFLTVTVVGLLAFACFCHAGFLKGSKAANNESSNDGMEASSSPQHFIDPIELTKMKEFRSKSLAPISMPARLKVNPDGSHCIEAYHGNRRLTISMG